MAVVFVALFNVQGVEVPSDQRTFSRSYLFWLLSSLALQIKLNFVSSDRNGATLLTFRS